MKHDQSIIEELHSIFPKAILAVQSTADTIPTLWTSAKDARFLLAHLKSGIAKPYQMLFDLTVIDERNRSERKNQPESDFTIVYHLLSLDRNSDIRIKVPLLGDSPALASITDLWPSANWYEREAWDMFGVRFAGHPHLIRILMPTTWEGHPLRKDHPARATEMDPYQLPDEKEIHEQDALQFKPWEWGLSERHGDRDYLFLNLGPHHVGTHGVFRLILQLDGEVVVNAIPDIGYHHRAAEKMGERQTWHTYIPYTDRVDYLAGAVNNLAYLTSVEKLADIEVPERVKVIRVMLAELFRLASHLVFYGTFAQDIGAMSPVFYMFTDRERIFDIIEAICGARMHPSWFRIGGVAADLPDGWDVMVRDFIEYLPKRLNQYEKLVLQNRIFKDRTQGIGRITLQQAIEWNFTGPNLRACGLGYDLRKARPFSGYDLFDFEIPTATAGDAYARAVVRAQEMRQSLRIVRQCLENMPPGPYKSNHPLTTPPRKENTMRDIETLIDHFMGVSWGPVMPPGEACVSAETTKGITGYYLISDGNTHSYRTRIRTPSFPHLQALPLLCNGGMVSDVLAVLGSMDYVMSDVDR